MTETKTTETKKRSPRTAKAKAEPEKKVIENGSQNGSTPPSAKQEPVKASVTFDSMRSKYSSVLVPPEISATTKNKLRRKIVLHDFCHADTIPFVFLKLDKLFEELFFPITSGTIETGEFEFYQDGIDPDELEMVLSHYIRWRRDAAQRDKVAQQQKLQDKMAKLQAQMDML